MRGRRFSNYLRRFRRERGLTQKQVAIILGLKTTGNISRWEHGVSLPELLSALKMAVLYQVEVDSIYQDIKARLDAEITPRAEKILQSSGCYHERE